MAAVLHVITKLELGGAQLATLAQVARGGSFTERYLAFGPGGLLDAEATAVPGIACVPLRRLVREVAPLSDLAATLELALFVRRLRRATGDPVWVHTHSSKAGVVGRLGAFLGGAHRIVHSIHGFGHAHHGGRLSRLLMTAAEHLASRVTDGFVADSRQNLDDAAAAGFLKYTPRRVVRCGVQLEEFSAPRRARAEVRRELGLGADDEVVLCVACLKPQKDPLTFVRVAAAVSKQRPKARFVWAGDGELRDAMVAEADRLGLGPRLSLLGWRRDVPDLLHAADLFLLTSRWEGLPQVLPQAMAARLPIVATRVDGNPEAVGDDGLLVEAGDVAGIAGAVVELLGDPARRRRLAERAAARAEEFSEAGMLRQLDAFYEELSGALDTPSRARRVRAA